MPAGKEEDSHSSQKKRASSYLEIHCQLILHVDFVRIYQIIQMVNNI